MGGYLGYLGWFGASHAEPGFTSFSGAFLYGRVADFASCQGLSLALAGLIAGARRRDGRTHAGLLFTASALLVLMPPALFATFDWRYQLPQLTLIPVAAAIGASPADATAMADPIRIGTLTEELLE